MFIKSLLSLFVALLLSVFSGCSNGKFVNQRKEANIILDNLIIALENSDAQYIKDMFSSNVQENWEGLEEQIDDMLSYFNGDVISYDIVRTVAGGESIREGRLIYSGITNAKSKKIVTTESTYTISFSAVLIDDDEANEGLWRIWIGKSDEDYIIIGDSNMHLH